LPHHVDVHIGRKLRKARLSRGLTQTDLGNSVGVTFQQIQKYEKGGNRIGGSRLWMFSEVLKISIDFFYEGLKSDVQKTDISIQALRMANLLEEIPEGSLKNQVYQLIKTVHKGK